MLSKRFLTVIALVGLTSGPVLAQTTAPATQPATPARPVSPAPAANPPSVLPPAARAPIAAAPATAAPAATVPRATTPASAAPGVAAASTPSTTLVNLNTATATQLDKLPEVGKARAKAIVAERAKGAFKSWPDFDTRMAGTSINAGVKAKIKDRVTF